MSDLFMQNLNTGLTITIIGMLVVMAFLVLMIFAISLSTKIVEIYNKYFPEVLPEDKTTKKKVQVKDDSQIAIAVAMAHHASKGGK
ncbi:MAG: hypothetical protein E7Z88_07060 [Cyanobacteria bacterium SIG27]|nr:hypothetical protein [Cyanobacteria bacterium SIG27]